MLSVRETQAAGELAVALYSPAQQRAPRGDPEGGRWVAEGAGGQMALDFEQPAEPEPATPRAPAKLPVAEDPEQTFLDAVAAGRAVGSTGLGGGVMDAKLLKYRNGQAGIWKQLGLADSESDDEAALQHNGHSEVAAYRIDQLLGLGIVPATAYARAGRKDGTSQRLIPDFDTGENIVDAERDKLGHRTGKARQIDPRQAESALVLDRIIGGIDRNPANWGLDGQGKLWAIDHGHATWWSTAERTGGVPGDFENTLADYLRWGQQAGASYPQLKPGADVAPGLGSFTWQIERGRLAEWRKFTRTQFDAAFVGIDRETANTAQNAVDPKQAWENFQYILKTGQVVY